jgi:hypothetical protein
MRTLALAVAATAALLAACGTRSHDLFAVERAGSIPDAELRMVVNDGGTVTCDGDAPATLSNDELLEARELEDEIQKAAAERVRLAPRPNSILQYTVRSGEGTVTFADNSRSKPPALDRLAFFVRRVAKERCGRKR